MTGKYSSSASRETGVEYEPSATEPVQVVLSVKCKAETAVKVDVAGGQIAEQVTPGGLTVGGETIDFTFIVPPGSKWQVPGSSGVESIKSVYLTV